MFHYVDQPVSNCVRLPLGAEQVVHGGFLELWSWEQQPAAPENDATGAVSEPKQ